MLKRQKPTESPARFSAKSMNSLFEAVSNVCSEQQYMYEQSRPAGGGFMPRKGGGAFGSPATTDPTGLAGKKPSHSGTNKPGSYLKYGLGLPASLYTIGGALEATDQFFPEVGAKGAEIALGLGLGALGLGIDNVFGAKGSPINTSKFRGRGFRVI